MGNSLINILNCPFCKGDLALKQHPQKDHGNGDLVCSSCAFKCPIRNGVADFIEGNCHKKTNQLQKSTLSQYDGLWASALSCDLWPTTLIEKKTIDRLMSDNSPKVILDVGSGIGRHIPLLTSVGAEYLICLESSAVIYEVAKKFGRNLNGTNVAYVRGDIESISFKDECVDIVWAIGILNFFSSQQQLIEKFANISTLNVVLGLNSGGLLGKLYTRLNIIRPLAKWIPIKKILLPVLGFFAFLIVCILNFLRVMRRIVNPKVKHFEGSKNKTKHLRNLLLEPFIAPHIFRYPDGYYEHNFENQNYILIDKFTNSFVSILYFKKLK